MPRKEKPRYTVIRDTREKTGQGWWFSESDNCQGTISQKVQTGDYTLKGYEQLFTIERKASISELAANLIQDRFTREVERFRDLKLAVIMCEFEFSDLMTWPHAPGMTKDEQAMISPRTNRWYLMQRVWELQLASPNLSFMFVGRWGKEAASSLFKRVMEDYGQKNQDSD